jgi:predicted membrane protein
LLIENIFLMQQFLPCLKAEVSLLKMMKISIHRFSISQYLIALSIALRPSIDSVQFSIMWCIVFLAFLLFCAEYINNKQGFIKTNGRVFLDKVMFFIAYVVLWLHISVLFLARFEMVV